MLAQFCHKFLGAQLESVRVAAEFAEASALIDEVPIDLLLLDLNLHGCDGMELLTRSVAGSFHTIIVSASPERAVQAFELGVIDFVPKPFLPDRLARALARVTERDGRTAGATKYLAVKKHGKIELVEIDRIVYLKGAGAYAELMLDDGTCELHSKTLEKLHALLPPVFERIHKSYVVRWNAVKALHVREGSHYEAELMNGVHLPIGRSRYRDLRKKLR